MANGAFGQVRIARDNVTDEELAVKLENSNAKMPMLFLEYRFYKVRFNLLIIQLCLCLYRSVPTFEK